jgi:lysyl-tRNA synthetase class 2
MAYLLATNGLDRGQAYELVPGDNVIGRDADCNVHLNLSSVSRQHVRLVADDPYFTISDLDSANGTKINDQQLTNPVSLQPGDAIKIADLEFSFVLELPDIAAQAPNSNRADFQPTAELPTLQRRSKLLAQVRAFFDEHGFDEVETPVLSRDTVVDRYLFPLPVVVHDETYWLQTSPEFHMKRLLAAGMNAIYQITRAFRNDENGPHHNLEFTLLEWYRTSWSTKDAIAFLGSLVSTILSTAAHETVSYQQAFIAAIDIDPLEDTTKKLLRCIAGLDFQPPENWRSMDRDGWLDLLFSEYVQPTLGLDVPTILVDYPLSQAALARQNPDNPKVADRFELFFHGLELANGYHELLDVQELRRRNERSNRQREQAGHPRLPPESYLETAMQNGLPDCCGVALGLDRLVMLATAATDISEVIAFPFDRA